MTTHSDRCWQDLANVSLISEVAYLWGMTVDRVHTLCDEGKVIATQPEHSNVWMVSLRDMIAKYGPPVNLHDCPEALVDLRMSI